MDRRGRRTLLVVGFVASVASGCVAGQAEIASPLGASASTVPSQPTQATPSVSRSALPSATESSGPPSPETETELQALLPNFVGTDYTTKRAFTLAEIRKDGLAGGPARAVSRLFDAMGARSDSFEAAEAHSSKFSIVALRIGGVDPVDLAGAMVDAITADEAGSSVTSRQVDGREVRRISRPADSLQRDSYVTVNRDIAFVASPFDDDPALVDAVFASLFEPRFEDILPAELDGKPLVRYGMPGIAAPTGGDMCTVICPGEANRIAAELGVTMDDVDLGVSYLDGADGVLIVAMRFKGVATDRLIPARIATSGSDSEAAVQRQVMIAGKPTTLVDYGFFGVPEFLYVKDDVLFIIRIAVDRDAKIDDVAVPPVLDSAMRALP